MHDDLRGADGDDPVPAPDASARAAFRMRTMPIDEIAGGPAPQGAAPTGRRRGRWLLALAVVALLGAGGWWVSRKNATPASAPSAAQRGSGGRFGAGIARVQPVSVATVVRRDVPVVVTALGSIAAANTAVVRVKVGGQLLAIKFSEGQPVRAGQVLALIDPKPFEIALEQAQAALARDQAQLANARVDLARYQDLVAKEAAPEQQLATQDALVKQLGATVQSDQAALDNAKLQLSYTRVVAPISGLAGLKQADLGNVVNPGDANGLLSVAQLQPAAVVFSVPEAQLALVRRRMKAGDTLLVQAWDSTQKVLLAQGRVASTDNAIDPATGTIKLKALFPNTDNALFPNQFVNVRLQLDTVHDTLAVPGAALQRGAPGTYVYAVAPDDTVALRVVKVITTDGDVAAVQGDLQAGERVVVDGADRLRDGARVEIIVPDRSGKSGKSANAAAASGASAAAVAARPRWMDRVPPDMVKKLEAMSDDQRRAWLREHRGASGASN